MVDGENTIVMCVCAPVRERGQRGREPEGVRAWHQISPLILYYLCKIENDTKSMVHNDKMLLKKRHSNSFFFLSYYEFGDILNL